MAAVAYAPRAPTAPLVAAGLRGGGDVPAPPIGQPSDRSIGAQSRLQIRERCWRRRRSQRRRQQLPLLSNAPRSDAGVLGPPMDDEGSAGRASAGPVAPSARGTCRRPDDSRRATADGGAVGAAAAAPPVGGALVVAWAALRRRSARPGSGGSLRRHGFERGCLASSGAGGGHPVAVLFFLPSKIRAN